MAENYCRIHQAPMLLKRMNGGWTTVCPWCDQLGVYDRRTVQAGAHEAGRGYRYRGGDVGVVGYTDLNNNNGKEGY